MIYTPKCKRDKKKKKKHRPPFPSGYDRGVGGLTIFAISIAKTVGLI